MSIDKLGEWWVGTQPGDIRAFLDDYAPEGYEVHEFRISKCSCGSDVFNLDADDTEGTAKRTCVKCQSEHLICDSAEYWKDAGKERCVCPCTSELMNIGVGFSLYPDDHEVKWLYVGCRCASCGVLGCYAGWKIAYAPSRHLFDQV